MKRISLIAFLLCLALACLVEAARAMSAQQFFAPRQTNLSIATQVLGNSEAGGLERVLHDCDTASADAAKAGKEDARQRAARRAWFCAVYASYLVDSLPGTERNFYHDAVVERLIRSSLGLALERSSLHSVMKGTLALFNEAAQAMHAEMNGGMQDTEPARAGTSEPRQTNQTSSEMEKYKYLIEVADQCEAKNENPRGKALPLLGNDMRLLQRFD